MTKGYLFPGMSHGKAGAPVRGKKAVTTSAMSQALKSYAKQAGEKQDFRFTRLDQEEPYHEH